MRSVDAANTSEAGPPSSRGFFLRPCFWIGMIVFTAALALRICYICEYERSIEIDYSLFDQTDNHTFDLWAENIARGDWLCENQIHPYHNWTELVAPENKWIEWYHGSKVYHQCPLYPYFVASIYALFGFETFYVKMIQAIMGAASCLFVFLIARLYFGRTSGLFAGLILAFSGFHFYYDAFILREGLVTFLTVLFVFLSLLSFKHRKMALFLCTGFVLGLGIAAKPNALLLVPIYLAAVFLLFADKPLRGRLLRTAVFAAAVLLPLAPFYARNAAVGSPVFQLSTRGPTAFINGNAKGLSGTKWAPPPALTRNILTESNYNLLETIKETLKTYRDDPFAYPALIWDKTSAFFNSYEIPNNTNWIVAPAGILGMLLLLPRIRRIWQLYLLTFVLSASTIAFFIVARFRQPVVPLLAIFAGYTAVWMLKKMYRMRLPTVTAAGVLLCFLMSWTDHDKPIDNSLWGAYAGAMWKLAAQSNFTKAEVYKDKMRLGYKELTGGRYCPDLDERLDRFEDAFRAFRKYPESAPDNIDRQISIAHGFLKMTENSKRNSDDFKKFSRLTTDNAEGALRIDPKAPDAHKILGIYHVIKAERSVERSDKFMHISTAFEHFTEELKIDPDDTDCLKGIGFIHLLLGKPELSASYYKRYLERIEPWDHEIASQLASILLKLQDNDKKRISKALALTTLAVNHEPNNLKFCRNHYYALLVAGRVEEAIAVLERLKKLDPLSADDYESQIKSFMKLSEKSGSGDKITNQQNDNDSQPPVNEEDAQ